MSDEMPDFGGEQMHPVEERETEPRPRGCRCFWEAGDSPCPVHDAEAEDTEHR